MITFLMILIFAAVLSIYLGGKIDLSLFEKEAINYWRTREGGVYFHQLDENNNALDNDLLEPDTKHGIVGYWTKGIPLSKKNHEWLARQTRAHLA